MPDELVDEDVEGDVTVLDASGPMSFLNRACGMVDMTPPRLLLLLLLLLLLVFKGDETRCCCCDVFACLVKYEYNDIFI